MRKTTPLYILLGFQLLFAVLALLFHQGVRPGLLTTYAEAKVTLSTFEKAALSSWLLPAVTLLSAIASASGFGRSVKSARRLRRVATGLTLQALLAVVAALLGMLPMLRG